MRGDTLMKSDDGQILLMMALLISEGQYNSFFLHAGICIYRKRANRRTRKQVKLAGV